MSVITISRQFGAGGISLGETIAAKLNYTLYHNEIIEMIANAANTSTDSIVTLEEQTGGGIKNLLAGRRSTGLIQSIFDTQKAYMDPDEYIRRLTTIIIQIADEDNAIIVGRGAQYILKDRADVFHVLIFADYADRVGFMQSHYGLDHAAAVDAVQKENYARENLFRLLNVTDFDRPDAYHLVLNMSRITSETACDLILELLPAA